MPELRPPPTSENANPASAHPPRPLGPLRTRQNATAHHRAQRKLNEPEHLVKPNGSTEVTRRRWSRIRPRRRHRLHRPRPRPRRRKTDRRNAVLPRGLPRELHRNLTQRQRPPHLGNRRTRTRHPPNHQRHQHRALQHRQVHHHHRQRLPTGHAQSDLTCTGFLCTRQSDASCTNTGISAPA